MDGIDPDDVTPPQPYDTVTDVFTSLSARVSRFVHVSKTGATRAVESVMPAPKHPSVFLFGDSITEYSFYVTHPGVSPGWSALLRETYGNSVDVFTRGFSGYNTRWALHIFSRLVSPVSKTSALKAVVIFFGANDAALPGNSQHVPLDEYKQNLTKLVQYVNILPGGPLPILIAPPALASEGKFSDGKRTAQNTTLYAEACVETGRQLGVPVVDLHAAMVGRAKGDHTFADFLSDGLHLSATGNRLVYELLTEIFRECVPELSPDQIEPLFPHYTEIDPTTPSLALGANSLV